MIEINTVNVQRFSLNGIEYFKNFLSKVSENTITIYNAYDSRDVRVSYENYLNISVDGVFFTSAADLQSALLPVIYTRDSLGGSVYIGDNFNRITLDNGFSLGLSSSVIINSGSEWIIRGIDYTNTSQVFIQIPATPVGKKRIDYIVANQNNTFERIAGIEVNDNQIAVAPSIPDTKLAYTFVTVDNTGANGTPPVDNNFVKIQERLKVNFDSSSNFITLNDDRKFINLINDSQNVFDYIIAGNNFSSGQNHPLIIRNNSNTNKTITHNYFGSNSFISGGQSFYFQNLSNFLIKPKEIIQFVYDTESNRYELVGLIPTNVDISTKADLVNGKVPASQLPSYVDDVLEFANLAAFPANGETGKIYVAIDDNKQYRWSGSVYIDINSGSLLAKEDLVNKSQNVNTDQASTVKYPSVKALFDWAVGRFQNIIGNYVASPTNGTITNTNVVFPLATNTNAGLLRPDEKLAIANNSLRRLVVTTNRAFAPTAPNWYISNNLASLSIAVDSGTTSLITALSLGSYGNQICGAAFPMVLKRIVYSGRGASATIIGVVKGDINVANGGLNNIVALYDPPITDVTSNTSRIIDINTNITIETGKNIRFSMRHNQTTNAQDQASFSFYFEEVI